MRVAVYRRADIPEDFRERYGSSTGRMSNLQFRFNYLIHLFCLRYNLISLIIVSKSLAGGAVFDSFSERLGMPRTTPIGSGTIFSMRCCLIKSAPHRHAVAPCQVRSQCIDVGWVEGA